MVSNSASVALAPLLAIWLTKSFQPCASSFCWAAISGEWHWAQTFTITSRPCPSGKDLKSSAKTGVVSGANTTARQVGTPLGIAVMGALLTASTVRAATNEVVDAKLSAGVRANIDRVTLQVSGDNLTNSHGLTEGNPRFLAAPGAALPDVRPIFGRSFRFSVGYAF